MRELRVQLAAADGGGCGFYRMLEPARVARDMGVHAVVKNDLEIEGEQHIGELKPRIFNVHLDCDVLVLQRPLLESFSDIIPMIQDKGVAVVVEIDDDFEYVHPRNHVWATIQPEHSPHSNWRHVKRACLLADWVTVSTPALARYAPHGRVSVLRNRVPAKYLSITPPERTEKAVRVGWTGTLQTHPDDLEVARGGVWRGVEEAGAELTIVGDGVGIHNALGIPDDVKIGATGWVDLEHYIAYTALLLDVGIVPLEKSRFNDAKSYIKGLEMASLGIPFVASPVPEYRQLALHDIGQIADRPRDWYKRVRDLAKSKDLRDDLGGRYREIVKQKFTYETAGEEWVGAWLSALKQRRSDRKTA